MIDESDRAYRNAVEKKDSGEYSGAAEWYAAAGLHRIFSPKSKHNKNLRVGVGLLLLSMSCDIVDGNDYRAMIVFRMTDPVIEYLYSNSTERVLIGICSEWRGDIRLFTGKESPMPHYDDAAENYRYISDTDKNYGSEPEYVHSIKAYQIYANSIGVSLPEDHDYNFSKRVKCKISTYQDTDPE